MEKVRPILSGDGGTEAQRLCQITKDAYPFDTRTYLPWPFVGGHYSYAKRAGTEYIFDSESSVATCNEVGYLLEQNVLRGEEDQCPLRHPVTNDLRPGHFCWGQKHQGWSNSEKQAFRSSYGFSPSSHYRDSYNHSISRGKFAIWLARGLNGGQDPAAPAAGTPSPFTDVDDTQDWWPHVYYLANHPNLNLGHLSWPHDVDMSLAFELSPHSGPQGTFTYSPSQFWNSGFATSPTQFSPDGHATAGWAGILVAKAFAIPLDSTVPLMSALGPYYTDISRFTNLNGQSTHITRYLNGTVHTTPNLLHFVPDRSDSAHYLYSSEVIEAFRQSAGLYHREFYCRANYQHCLFMIDSTRKSTLAQILATGMAYFAASKPPSCAIEPAVYEILDSGTRVGITLENPTREDIDIDLAKYTIERSGSPDNQLNVDALAIAGNPSVIPASGQVVLYSAPQAISQNGLYAVSWNIEMSAGSKSWTTAAGEILTSEGNPCESSLRVVYRPFVKVFYAGLASGGQFGTKPLYAACGENFAKALGGDRTISAFVAGHTDGSGPSDMRGSSAEYALQAYGAIGGFYSASQRSTDPIPIKGLTLANDDAAAVFGGGHGRKTCLSNWWREVEKLDLETKPSPLELELDDLNPNDRLRYELSSGETLELKTSYPLGGLKATLYVKGDVLITSDIDNQAAVLWHDPSEIGGLTIIAKGNIDIAPGVERIDALLAAYPSGLDSANNPSGGRIRTCWDPVLTDPASADSIHFHTCDKQLVINGALIAEKVLFGRVHASIVQETVSTTPPPLPPAEENIANILGGSSERGRLCQLALDAYPIDTDTEWIKWNLTGPYSPAPGHSDKYNIAVHSSGLYPTTDYFTDRGASPGTCDEVGYLLELNVLRAEEDACRKHYYNPVYGRFCWGHNHNYRIWDTPTARNLYFSAGYRPTYKDSDFAQVPRGQFAIWLARGLNGGQDPAAPAAGTPSPFTDVDDTQDWWPHVYYLANHPDVDFRTLGKWVNSAAVYPPPRPSGWTALPVSSKQLPSNPTLFYPNDDATFGWAAAVLAKAFKIPPGGGGYWDVYRPWISYKKQICGVDQNGLPLCWWDYNHLVRRSDYPDLELDYVDDELTVLIGGIGLAGIHRGDYRAFLPGWCCVRFQIDGTRKSVLAKMLARAMAYSGVRSSNSPSAASSPGLSPRTTEAAEVINLLPEYLVGIPELPLFADQIYKTESTAPKPANF